MTWKLTTRNRRAGLTALIQTQQTVMAAEGEEAHFSCRLTQSKDVLQVSWQKQSPTGMENLCSYTTEFGQQVNPDFRDKVEFEAAGLQNSSIVIRKVTELDEGCYHCLFNSYPEGALKGTTCLHLYELHEPILHVRQSNSSEEALVSCSATGRPAPTVTLRVLQKDLHLSGYSSVSVTNSNGTVTVTTTAVLSASNDSSTQVGCAVRVLSGPQIETSVMLPEVKRSSADDGFDEESEPDDSDRSHTWIIMLSLFGACALIAAFTFFLLQPKTPNRDVEMNEMPQTTVRGAHETEASSVQQERDPIRLRASPVKIQASDLPNPSPSTSRRL
ncbi:OX-2 membrane glycoprotein-like [Chelmon rostratus]|uniref:OX-2 membrane glycoprotein-like n=1 Tax=Chelmon rostratus TaxID=109905 RepID=UPI001BEAD592|nr:OX-2 membrane glycoprotein-like [Chelmon rostratus]